MGTEIYRHHVFTNRSFDELCLSDPKLIRHIHADYCDAGADVLTTNTFGANRVALAKYGLAEKRRRDRPRRRPAGPRGRRRGRPAGLRGRLDRSAAQRSRSTRTLIEAMIVEQVPRLMEGGADFVLFETQPNRQALEQCAAAMRQLPDVPFVLSFAVVGHVRIGLRRAGRADAGPAARRTCPPPVAWGMNCGTGPDGLLGAVERAVRLTPLPLIVQPNAGLPREVDNRRIYFCSPEYLTTYARRYVELGAAAVGGCCGTTPEHIREVAQAVKPLARAQVQRGDRRSRPPAVRPKEPAPFAEKSRLAWRLAHRQWVTTVELCRRAATT